MEVWKIVFHSWNLPFHSILASSIFHTEISVPFHFPFHTMPRLSNGKNFFGLYPQYLARRFFKNFQSTSGPMQCKSGPVENMVSKRSYLLYDFSTTFTSTWPVFTRQYTAEKKSTQENAYWTNYCIWIEWAWAPWPYVYSYSWLFPWPNKNLQKLSWKELFYSLLQKILQEAMQRTSPYLGQISYKL